MTFPLASTRVRSIALFTAFALTTAACSSSSGGTSDPGADGGMASGDCKAGKNAAWAMPAGAAFALPAGVSLAGEITGDVAPNCGDKSFVEYGGDYLPVCFGLKNTSTADVTVKLPAGLVFLSKNPATQNGIILQSHDLKVAAGATEYFSFRLFCLNMHCEFGGKADRFTFGNVSNDSKMAELISLAASKKLKVGSDISGALVLAVWDITDGDGLTQEHRSQVQAAQ